MILCLLTAECRGCSDIGQMACYDSVASGCCNVYVNETCADACPNDTDTYVTDLNLVCGKFVSSALLHNYVQ